MLSKGRKSRKADEASAVVIPFPVVPRRGAEIAAKLPFLVVPRREAPANEAAPKPASPSGRPAVPPAARSWRWWEIGLLASLALHVAAAAVFQAKYAYELERAAGAALAASAEGSNIIPIEVLVTAALPSAPAPTDATAPEATKPAETTPKETSEEKQEKTAPPPKSDMATEVVPTAKETPRPQRDKHEHKERAQKSASAAANPSPSAAARAEGRAGARGRAEAGGAANVSSYQALVLAHLQHYRQYPAEARSHGVTGIATVRFALAANGSVISAGLARSSGAGVLDDAAVSMVRRASPFPPFPPGLSRSQMDFAAPIRFDLR